MASIAVFDANTQVERAKTVYGHSQLSKKLTIVAWYCQLDARRYKTSIVAQIQLPNEQIEVQQRNFIDTD